MRLPFVPWSIAGVPSSQALPGYLITAPPSLCVPDVSGALACGFQTKKKKFYHHASLWITNQKNNHLCAVNGALAVWRHNQKKRRFQTQQKKRGTVAAVY